MNIGETFGRNRQVPTGVVVEDPNTNARGVVLKGGFRPRVQWHPTGRISRPDGDPLRLVALDEFPLNAWQR